MKNFWLEQKVVLESLQIEALKQSGFRHIKNPTELLKLEAVKQNYYSIQHIEEPSEQG